jgi:hypothetical protein
VVALYTAAVVALAGTAPACRGKIAEVGHRLRAPLSLLPSRLTQSPWVLVEAEARQKVLRWGVARAVLHDLPRSPPRVVVVVVTVLSLASQVAAAVAQAARWPEGEAGAARPIKVMQVAHRVLARVVPFEVRVVVVVRVPSEAPGQPG